MIFNTSSGTIRRTSAGLLKPSPRASYTAPSGIDKVQVESINRPAGAVYIAPEFSLNKITPAVYISYSMQEGESNG